MWVYPGCPCSQGSDSAPLSHGLSLSQAGDRGLVGRKPSDADSLAGIERWALKALLQLIFLLPPSSSLPSMRAMPPALQLALGYTARINLFLVSISLCRHSSLLFPLLTQQSFIHPLFTHLRDNHFSSTAGSFPVYSCPNDAAPVWPLHLGLGEGTSSELRRIRPHVWSEERRAELITTRPWCIFSVGSRGSSLLKALAIFLLLACLLSHPPASLEVILLTDDTFYSKNFSIFVILLH